MINSHVRTAPNPGCIPMWKIQHLNSIHQLLLIRGAGPCVGGGESAFIPPGLLLLLLCNYLFPLVVGFVI